jgi:hypothetical protein
MAAALKKPRRINRQVQLAQALIRNWYTRDFDFTSYDDQHRSSTVPFSLTDFN